MARTLHPDEILNADEPVAGNFPSIIPVKHPPPIYDKWGYRGRVLSQRLIGMGALVEYAIKAAEAGDTERARSWLASLAQRAEYVRFAIEKMDDGEPLPW